MKSAFRVGFLLPALAMPTGASEAMPCCFLFDFTQHVRASFMGK